MKKIRYNIAEAAELLSCSPKTIYSRICEGEILDTYKDGRKIYIPRKSLIDYFEKKMRAACVSELHIKEMKSLL